MAGYPVFLRTMLSAATVTLCIAISNASGAEVEIIKPSNEETIHDNSGKVTVVVNAELDRGQRIRILVDNSVAAPDNEDGRFQLLNIDRGEHRLKARVVNESGDTVAESESIVIYMWRASKLFPGRQR